MNYHNVPKKFLVHSPVVTGLQREERVHADHTDQGDLVFPLIDEGTQKTGSMKQPITSKVQDQEPITREIFPAKCSSI